MFLLELQQRPNADADQKHADDEPLNGVHAEENCTAAEEASGAPFGLDGLGNGIGEIRRVRCCFARSLVARLSSRRARERAMAWGRRRRKPRAARRAMKRATIDEATELSSARRGGATECGAAAEGWCHGGWRAARQICFEQAAPFGQPGWGSQN